jgi:hypothetical protein
MRRVSDQHGLSVGESGDGIAEHLVMHLDVGSFSAPRQCWLCKKFRTYSQIAWIEGWNVLAQLITSSADASWFQS